MNNITLNINQMESNHLFSSLPVISEQGLSTANQYRLKLAQKLIGLGIGTYAGSAAAWTGGKDHQEALLKLQQAASPQ